MSRGSRTCAQTSPPPAATIWYTHLGSGWAEGLSQGQEKRPAPPSPDIPVKGSLGLPGHRSPSTQRASQPPGSCPLWGGSGVHRGVSVT